jgi:hypothetical protein
MADNEIAVNAGWREELLAMKRKLLSSTWLAWIGSDISTRRSGLPSARTSNSGTSLFGPTTMAVSARSIDPVMSSSLPYNIGDRSSFSEPDHTVEIGNCFRFTASGRNDDN